MEWWEKEVRFERSVVNGTYAKDLWKYIPKLLLDAVDDASVDMDGYWIYLKEGWHMDGERTIHCYTISDLKDDIARIEKVK